MFVLGAQPGGDEQDWQNEHKDMQRVAVQLVPSGGSTSGSTVQAHLQRVTASCAESDCHSSSRSGCRS
jgi:hypothetical protein